jgi:hypothetical protein
MKKILGIVFVICFLFVGCDLGTGSTVPYVSDVPNNTFIDPAFWFADIYDALMYRKVNSIMGTIANTQYVCDAINAKWGTSLTPVIGTEMQAANCEYLLKMIDMANSNSTSYGTSSYATQQAIDTIAVDAAVNKFGGKFVAVSANGRTAYSINGTSWIISPTTMTGSSTGWNRVAYGNGVSIAAN